MSETMEPRRPPFDLKNPFTWPWLVVLPLFLVVTGLVLYDASQGRFWADNGWIDPITLRGLFAVGVMLVVIIAKFLYR